MSNGSIIHLVERLPGSSPSSQNRTDPQVQPSNFPPGSTIRLEFSPINLANIQTGQGGLFQNMRPVIPGMDIGTARRNLMALTELENQLGVSPPESDRAVQLTDPPTFLAGFMNRLVALQTVFFTREVLPLTESLANWSNRTAEQQQETRSVLSASFRQYNQLISLQRYAMSLLQYMTMSRSSPQPVNPEQHNVAADISQTTSQAPRSQTQQTGQSYYESNTAGNRVFQSEQPFGAQNIHVSSGSGGENVLNMVGQIVGGIMGTSNAIPGAGSFGSRQSQATQDITSVFRTFFDAFGNQNPPPAQPNPPSNQPETPASINYNDAQTQYDTNYNLSAIQFLARRNVVEGLSVFPSQDMPTLYSAVGSVSRETWFKIFGGDYTAIADVGVSIRNFVLSINSSQRQNIATRIAEELLSNSHNMSGVDCINGSDVQSMVQWTRNHLVSVIFSIFEAATRDPNLNCRRSRNRLSRNILFLVQDTWEDWLAETRRTISSQNQSNDSSTNETHTAEYRVNLLRQYLLYSWLLPFSFVIQDLSARWSQNAYENIIAWLVENAFDTSNNELADIEPLIENAPHRPASSSDRRTNKRARLDENTRANSNDAEPSNSNRSLQRALSHPEDTLRSIIAEATGAETNTLILPGELVSSFRDMLSSL